MPATSDRAAVRPPARRPHGSRGRARSALGRRRRRAPISTGAHRDADRAPRTRAGLPRAARRRARRRPASCPPARHRALQLGLLHADTRRARRAHARHPRAPTARSPSTAAGAPSTSCPAAPAATRAGCARLLAHAERIVAGAYAAPGAGERPGEEVFVGVAPRAAAAPATKRRRRRARAGCGSTSTGPTGSTRCGRSWPSGPCHLLIASGGSGGVHAYWKLDRAAARAAGRGPDGRRDRADRARARPDHPRARRRRATGGRTSPTRAAPSARA